MFYCLLVSLIPGLIWAKTDIKLYNPFVSMTPQVPLSDLRTQAGACAMRSQFSPRSDAWRCESQGKIYDPCFVRMRDNRKQVTCPNSAWSNQAMILQLSKSLPAPKIDLGDMANHTPWLLELATGDRCWRRTHQYHCQSGQTVKSHLHRCKLTWEANGADGMVEIKRVWY